MVNWTDDNNWGETKDDYKENFGNFDWRETPDYKHPKKCRCPRHEVMEEKVNLKNYPIIFYLCPDHHQIYLETKDEVRKKIYDSLTKQFGLLKGTFAKIIIKLVWHFKLVQFKELKEIRFGSDLCFYCKFGSGGRGKKHPISPDIP